MSEMPEVLSAPVFIEEGGFTSRITMVNELTFAITAEVVLFGRNGARITSQMVAFPIPSIATVYESSTSPTANFWGAGPGTGSATGFVRSASCNEGGGGTPVVIKPDHLQVTGDVTGTIQSCPTTVYRSVHYQAVDINNHAFNVAVSVSEYYLNSPVTNTCNNGQPSPSSCQPTDGSGSFWDTLQVGCNSVGGSCGFPLQHQWNWCNGGVVLKVLSTLTDTIHNNQVIVNGYTNTNPNGSQFH